MPRLAATIDNSCTKMATWNPSIPEHYPFRPINIKTASTTGLKWPPRAALDCQIWQFEVHTLNGRSGFFHSNQGLNVFPLWRQDCPLPPPINRSRFHVRSKRKIECKVDKKISLSPLFFIIFCFLLLSRTFGHYSRHRLSHYNLHHNQTLNNLTWWLHHLPPSISLLCENLFPLHHRSSSSSSNHPLQRLPPLPAAVEAATLSSSAPTASDRSIDRDSSSTCNSSSNHPGGSTLHRCHRLHHVVLLGQTTLTPSNFLPPRPPPLFHHHCPLREQ